MHPFLAVSESTWFFLLVFSAVCQYQHACILNSRGHESSFQVGSLKPLSCRLQCECVQPKYTCSLRPQENWLLIPQGSRQISFLLAYWPPSYSMSWRDNSVSTLVHSCDWACTVLFSALELQPKLWLEVSYLTCVTLVFNNCSPPSRSSHSLRSLTARSVLYIQMPLSVEGFKLCEFNYTCLWSEEWGW